MKKLNLKFCSNRISTLQQLCKKMQNLAQSLTEMYNCRYNATQSMNKIDHWKVNWIFNWMLWSIDNVFGIFMEEENYPIIIIIGRYLMNKCKIFEGSGGPVWPAGPWIGPRDCGAVQKPWHSAGQNPPWGPTNSQASLYQTA